MPEVLETKPPTEEEQKILTFAERNDLELRIMEAMGVKRYKPDSEQQWVDRYADKFASAVAFNPEIVELVKNGQIEEAVRLAIDILEK